jgi:Family of unknown function (DUF6884)
MNTNNKYTEAKKRHAALMQATRCWQKPVLILPCSEKKLNTAAPAIDLYQGTGYLGIVKTVNQQLLLATFNVYFLSAKYGLIRAKDVIEPYEKFLDKAQLEHLLKSNYLSAQVKALCKTIHQDVPVYLVAPIRYKVLFTNLANKHLLARQLVESSGGIGEQRGQLKSIINEAINHRSQVRHHRHITGHFHERINKSMTYNLYIQFHRGDRLRFWVSGAGEAATYSPPETITDITCDHTGIVNIHTEQGNQYTSFCAIKGCRFEHIARIKSKARCNTGCYGDVPTVTFSELANERQNIEATSA